MNIEETIKDRHDKYGSYSDWARITSELKRVLADNVASKDFNHIHAESLDMILSKIARIITGDPNLIDNWHDIAGYARLVEKEIKAPF